MCTDLGLCFCEGNTYHLVILLSDLVVLYYDAQVGYRRFVVMVFLTLKFVFQVLVQAQLIKSEPQLSSAAVMYTTAPVTDVAVTSSGNPTPAPASIHTLVNTAHGAILATGRLLWGSGICVLMLNYQRAILYCHLRYIQIEEYFTVLNGIHICGAIYMLGVLASLAYGCAQACTHTHTHNMTTNLLLQTLCADNTRRMSIGTL
jgi:hypothetical protein